VDFDLSMSQIAEISWFSKASIVEVLQSQNVQKKGRLRSPPKFGELINFSRERRPNKREQKIIRQMKAMRENGASFNQITKWLTSSGVPTKAGGAWHHFTVSEILKREMNKKEQEKNV